MTKSTLLCLIHDSLGTFSQQRSIWLQREIELVNMTLRELPRCPRDVLAKLRPRYDHIPTDCPLSRLAHRHVIRQLG